MRTLETRTHVRRRVLRRRRQVVGAGLLAFCVMLVLVGFRLAAALSHGPVATATSNSRAPVIAPQPPNSTPTPPTSPSEAVPARPTSIRATGEYARAPGGTVRHGSGQLVTYRVEVETGTGQSAPAFAATVDATLADPASWTGQGRWSVQRVTGDDVDLVIRLATPATVDKVCEAAGLDAGGYASCRGGSSS